MPFLRDEGPPVSQATIQRARESLPLEYGFQVVNETGRECLVVRVPKVKPDYLHDLADVAFYVDLDTIRNARDVLLVGHEKTARLEPQLLRDHIRAQQREDESVVHDLRRKLGQSYGYAVVQSPSNFQHKAIALRIPKPSVSEFSPEDVVAFRDALRAAKGQAESCQYAYIVAERDFERLGRRVLLELLGAAPGAPQPAEPSHEVDAVAPVAAPAPAPAPVPAAPARPSFPPTPGPASAAPPRHAPSGLVGLAASAAAAPSPAPPPAPVAPAPAAPAASPFPAPAPAPAAAPPAFEPEAEVHEEYEIISRPKAPAPAPAPSPAAPAPAPVAAAPLTPADDEPEYEIMTSSRAAPAPVPAAPAPAHGAAPALHEDDGDRIVEKATESFEVYTSKPRARDAAPAITPPGAGGFQNALNGAVSMAAPAKTKEYEIMGRASATPISAPVAAPAPPPAPAPFATRDDPRVIAPRASLPVPAADSGAPFLARTAPANPEGILAQRFRDAGYEIVEGLRAQGTVFAFAAHRPNGRRVLVKRAPEFGPDDATGLAQLAVALGADICLVVADRVLPGARLATWGTRIEVYGAAEVPALAF